MAHALCACQDRLYRCLSRRLSAMMAANNIPSRLLILEDSRDQVSLQLAQAESQSHDMTWRVLHGFRIEIGLNDLPVLFQPGPYGDFGLRRVDNGRAVRSAWNLCHHGSLVSLKMRTRTRGRGCTDRSYFGQSISPVAPARQRWL